MTRFAPYTRDTMSVPHVRSFLSLDAVTLDLQGADKHALIESLIALLPWECEEQRAQVLRAVWEREQVSTTCVGDGLAIPHGKADIHEDVLGAFGIRRPALSLDALDRQPVQFFFLLVSRPEAKGPHIRALAHVARVLKDRARRDALLEAASTDAVLRCFDQ